jgi:putative acetyltransferase
MHGWDAVFVLGDPAYYGRFNYSAEAAMPFESPYAGPYFMLLPLALPLPAASGQARHARAFAALG